IHIRNYETLLHFIEGRTKDQALITYQNHASTLDDPLLWGCLPQRILLNPNLMRWSLAAREIIFKNPVYNTFFEAGQIIPTVRGDGIYQPAIEASIKLLNDGKWVNIYPEGKVNQGKELLGFKWGIGRLVQETKKELIILPIYHSG
ncbi:Phospholipid/glycerol acyltransferase, partial [Neoconidiobolus thromboides FSU 785]